MLSGGIAIFLSSPTSSTFAKTVLITFIIFTFFFFGFSVLAWAFLNKNPFTVFNAKLIKRFHRVNMVFLGICIVYIDKIYNIFYVLPFFDLVFQHCRSDVAITLTNINYLINVSYFNSVHFYLYTFSFFLSPVRVSDYGPFRTRGGNAKLRN